MYDKDIECKIICPKCGQERVFNDREYVDTLQDWELPIICTKCHNRFVIHSKDVETFYKTAHGDIRIGESRKLKERIISLMEIKTKGKDSTYKHKDYKLDFYINDGKKLTSIVSIHNDYNTYCHIVEDDHCYVLYTGNGKDDKNCQQITYIFPEAFSILRDLPLL